MSSSLAGHPVGDEVRPEGYLHNSRRRAPGGAPGPARHRRWPGHAARAGPAGCSTRRRRRSSGTTSSFLVRSLGGVGVHAHPGGGRPHAGSGERSRRCTYRYDAYVLDIRLPAGVAAVPAGAQARTPTTPRGGGRPMRFIDSIEPVGEAETRVHPGGGRGLALRHRRLPRHPQHAQRRVHHPRRGAEHLAGADEDVPDPARVRLQDRGHRRRHPGRPARRAPSPGCAWSGTSSTASTTSTSPTSTSADVVRHRLVGEIVDAYDQHDADRESRLQREQGRPAAARRRPATGR